MAAWLSWSEADVSRAESGVQASFDYRGAWNETEGEMLKVTLTNDLHGTVYG